MKLPSWKEFAVLRAWFHPTVEVGDIFIFDAAENPFAKPPHRVIVRAVSGKWVNYSWLNSDKSLQDESCKLHTFMYCYKKCTAPLRPSSERKSPDPHGAYISRCGIDNVPYDENSFKAGYDQGSYDEAMRQWGNFK